MLMLNFKVKSKIKKITTMKTFVKRILEKFVDTEKMLLEENSEKVFIISRK